MSLTHALPAAAFPSRSQQAALPRSVALPGSGSTVEHLVKWGGLLAAGGLTAFLVLQHLGRLNLDTMTLLPAVALVGAAAMSLGTALACLRALRGA